ncbi:MAG: DUF3179 domain-containing protein [Roseivirga sp.]|nr:DUF3179 domain-containing protein [Roseivirga sp.]
MRLLTLFLFNFFLCSLVLGQSGVSGTIIDAETGEPVFGANVFVENTTFGAVSDPDGKFTINGNFGEYARLVVSHIAYRSKTLAIRNQKVVNFTLRAQVRELKTVEVKREKDRKWQRLYQKFQKAFLGTTLNAKQVVVKNPWVIEFSKNSDEGLTGYALEMLEIENRSTGYEIKFLLENFRLSTNETVYVGKPFFTPLTAENEAQEAAWQQAREKTYLGSKEHFLYALAQGKTHEEGFRLHKSDFDSKTGKFKTFGKVDPDKIFQEKRLKFDAFLKVVYIHEKPEKTFLRESNSTTKIGTGGNTNLGTGQIFIDNSVSSSEQVSFLFSRSSRGLAISDDGLLKNPEGLLEYGYWAWERVADLLPYDYHLELSESEAKGTDDPLETAETTSSKGPEKNGFDLSNATLPLAEIVSGGPKRDGIPTLSSPKFEAAADASWLKPEDAVIGVHMNGEARAYPVKILNWHEGVNDKIGDKPFIVSFCPLCGSGMVFSSQVTDQVLDFGISGLLYNSDLLLYDRQTESLWSQLEMKAISGKLVDTPLELLASYQMNWQDWKRKYPETTVLSQSTGFSRDYNREPYQGYSKTDRLLFAVKNRDSRLANKDEVVGVALNGQFKAYPIKKLRELKQNNFSDKIGEITIQLEFLPESNALIVTNEAKELIPSTRLFWFAWYAFHPDTEVY